MNNNNINLLPPSIKNAISYLKYPGNELTMLSENHREMVSKYLLNKPYIKEEFVGQVLTFF